VQTKEPLCNIEFAMTEANRAILDTLKKDVSLQRMLQEQQKLSDLYVSSDNEEES
jgi:DNA-binding IscR family transcriptional regulator